MKQLLLPLLFLSFLGARPPAIPADARWHDRGHVWIQNKAGAQIVWYENGVKKAEGPFSSNQKSGNWTFYYETGTVKGSGRYEANLKEGPWKIYHRNGKLEAEGEYRRDRREGQWTHFETDGTKSAEGLYRAGRKEGPWTQYYSNGKVFSKGAYRAGEAEGLWEYFFQGGQLHQTGKFEKDVRIGTWQICVSPVGPCGKEIYNAASQSGPPRISGLNPAEMPSQDGRGRRTPDQVLESMEGDVPDEVPPSLRGEWND